MKRILSIILVIAVFFSMCNVVFAGEMVEFSSGEDFADFSFTPKEGVVVSELPDETILACVEGVILYAEDIKSDGSIESEKKEQLVSAYRRSIQTNGIQTRATGTFADNCMKVISLANQNKTIIVDATITAKGFSQKELHTYLPNKAISDFAESLESKNRNTLAGTIISYIPLIGDAYTAASFIMSALKNQNIDKLRTLRNAGKAAAYSTFESSYGNSAAVAEWDKLTIKGKNYQSNDASQSKYTVNSIKYGKKL